MKISMRGVAVAVLTLTCLPVIQAEPAPADAASGINLIVRTTITIDRPVQEVWPRLIDLGAWMPDSIFRTEKGVPGKEGEVRRLISREPKAKDDSYVAETVRFTPFEQYVLKVANRDHDFFGFADFSLSSAGSKTLIVYDLYIEFSAAGLSKDEIRQQTEQHYKNARGKNAEYLGNLQALVEGKK